MTTTARTHVDEAVGVVDVRLEKGGPLCHVTWVLICIVAGRWW